MDTTDTPVWRACPVCAEPARPATGQNVHCARCGWQLASPLRLGRATSAELRDFDHDLAERQQQWDLDAAWRAVAGTPAEESAFGRLLSIVRGELPERPDLRRTPVRSVEEPTTTVRGLVEALHGTAAYERLSFIEIGVTGLSLWCATGASAGLAMVWSHSWPQVCPWLSSDADVQRFQLAGGIGTLRPVGPLEWDSLLDEALQQIARHVVPPVLLIRPAAGWPLLDRTIAAVRARFAPAAEVPPVADHAALNRLAAGIMAGVAHPEGYDVVLARSDPLGRGMVAVRKELFPPVVLAPDEERKTQVVVYGSPTGAPALLQVVTHGSAEPALAAGVTSVVLRLAAGEQAVVDAYQDGPGRIRLVHRVAAPAPGPWEQLAPHLPELLRADGTGVMVDLAVTVELGGEGDTVPHVHTRLGEARRLIELLSAPNSTDLALRVAVVGYGDHHYQQPWRPLAQPLGPARDALDRMRPWRAARISGDLVAPLEDALVAVSELDWRAGSRRFVVMLAGRPAHVPNGSGRLRPCVRQLDVWSVAAHLRERVGAELLPIVIPQHLDIATEQGREAELWAQRLWYGITEHGPLRDAESCARAVRARLQPSGPGTHLRLAAEAA